ncbi:hypothetical protein [Pseudoclavibacter helvolus]|uniref:hypothetical protein n=1 Tax=Pseudoclavibacter helvolus TaxID=255205 RepID=UPI000838AB63|nr:hypothetical protein [Pseudoclavibacter helvolus]
MSMLTFRAVNELTMASAVTSAAVAAVLAVLGQSDQTLMAWSLVALAVGAVSIVLNASLEQFRPRATKAGVR